MYIYEKILYLMLKHESVLSSTQLPMLWNHSVFSRFDDKWTTEMKCMYDVCILLLTFSSFGFVWYSCKYFISSQHRKNVARHEYPLKKLSICECIRCIVIHNLWSGFCHGWQITDTFVMYYFSTKIYQASNVNVFVHNEATTPDYSFPALQFKTVRVLCIL